MQNTSPTTLASQQSSEPKTQDSIYQTIMKRLSLLESNATLSLRYVEEQSQNLRDLLLRIEKKQNSRIDLFFNEFNNSVFSQLQLFRNQHSQFLTQAITDLQVMKKQADQDVSALSSRMTLLTDELMYQKKISLIQAVVLLVILGVVITTRGTPDADQRANNKYWPIHRLGLNLSLPGSPPDLKEFDTNEDSEVCSDEQSYSLDSSFDGANKLKEREPNRWSPRPQSLRSLPENIILPDHKVPESSIEVR